MRKAFVSLATVLGVLAGAPAQAAPAPMPASCPNTYKCIYNNAYFQTNAGMYAIGSYASLCTELPAAFNDKISSVANKGPLVIDFFQHTRCGGALYRFYSGTADNLVPGNDTYSSYRIHR